jgi:glycerol-3-phosphate dehydrogenase (NAD(P)+)
MPRGVAETKASYQAIGIAGAGAWGIALANACVRAGRDVALWGRDAEAMARLSATRESSRLPGVRLAANVVVSANVAALSSCEAVLVATPAQSTREAIGLFADALKPGAPIVSCAKGIERDTDLFMTQVLAATAPAHRTAILSGPSFAADVAAGLPTAVTLAAADKALAAALSAAIAGPGFRVYHTTDVRGVEIGGAAKNVLAIACGVAAGLALGASANAALIARGFAELSRFGAAFGAQPLTLTGLSGLGDLVLTCTTLQSRNFAFGRALGGGASVAEALASTGLAEGVATSRALLAMAHSRNVEMPIAESVDDVLNGILSPREAVGALLARPQRAEG